MRVQEKCNQEVVTTGELTINAKDLPEGWTSESLGDVTRDIRYGYTAKATAIKAGPKYLRITDIQDNTVDWNMVPFCEIESSKFNSYRLSAGDLVFARTGATTGKSYLIKTCPDSVFASYLIRVRPSAALLPEYVAAFFQSDSYWNQITENLSGSAQPNCNASKLASLLVPIPPLPEQRRIVAKLEALLSKVSTTQQRLSRVPGLLKRFRQSVLAAACSGKLTADWREENANANANATLNKAACTNLFGGFEIPKSWQWQTFGSASREITVGYVGPMAKEYVPDGVPFLRSLNVRRFYFDAANLKFVTREFHKKISKSRLHPGDVAIVRSGNAGIACVIPESLPEANCSDLVILRASHELSPHFACIFLNSSAAQAHIDSVKVGIAQGHFNVSSMKTTLVPLPPLAEQHEIVRRVEKLFAFADQIESRLKQAQAQVDRLTQSLLAKAFRGELVPTEAELARQQGRPYESANELLDRIRATQTTPTKPTRGKTTKG
jgi:type I restriction enzyme S subunit